MFPTLKHPLPRLPMPRASDGITASICGPTKHRQIILNHVGGSRPSIRCLIPLPFVVRVEVGSYDRIYNRIIQHGIVSYHTLYVVVYHYVFAVSRVLYTQCVESCDACFTLRILYFFFFYAPPLVFTGPTETFHWKYLSTSVVWLGWGYISQVVDSEIETIASVM